MPQEIIFAIAYVLFMAGNYILIQALSIPYQNKTDRLWKTEDEDGVDTTGN